MYHVHFGLEKRVFDDGIAQDAAVYLGARQQAIVADCSVALASSDAVVVLTGRPGTGKTTLAGTALRTTSTRLALGAFSGGAIGTVDFLDWLLTEFGFARERGTRAERLQTWRQFLSEARTTDSRVFVVVERAEELGIDGLRSLAALTAADLNGCPGANLLLLGDAALLDMLAARELEAFRQRIRFRHTLEPLTAAELALYVSHHVAQAGGEPMQLFPPETLGMLYAYSEGIPRLVNNLAETAASVAAARRAAHVAPAVVEEVARKFLGMTGASRHATERAASPVTPPAAPSAAPAVTPPAARSAAPPVPPPAARSAAPPVPPPAARSAAAIAPLATAKPAERTAAVDDVDDVEVIGDIEDDQNVENVEESTSTGRRPSTDSGSDLPILTDAVELPARGAGDTSQNEPRDEPRNEPRATPSDGYDDVEALPDMGAAMAETLFGDSDLDLLGAALAAGSWDDVENLAEPLAGSGRTTFDAGAEDADDIAPFAARAARSQ